MVKYADSYSILGQKLAMQSFIPTFIPTTYSAESKANFMNHLTLLWFAQPSFEYFIG